MTIEHVTCSGLSDLDRQELLMNLPLAPLRVNNLTYVVSGLPYIPYVSSPDEKPVVHDLETLVGIYRKYVSFCKNNNVAPFTDLGYALNHATNAFQEYLYYTAEKFEIRGAVDDTFVDSMKHGCQPARIIINSDIILGRKIDIDQYELILKKAEEVHKGGHTLSEGTLQFENVNHFKDSIQISPKKVELKFERTPGYDYGIDIVKNFLVGLGGHVETE